MQIEDHGASLMQGYLELSWRGVDHEPSGVEIIHRGKYKSIAKPNRKQLRRSKAV